MRIIWLSFGLVFAFTPAWGADSACDLGNPSKVSMALVNARKDYERRGRELEIDMKNKRIEFARCSSQKWRICWETRLEDAEKQRKELEIERSKLMSLREMIEKNPGPHKVMAYCGRIENDLFYGYEQYFGGIETYLALINNSTQLCNQGDCDEVLLEQGEKLGKEIGGFVGGLRELLALWSKK